MGLIVFFISIYYQPNLIQLVSTNNTVKRTTSINKVKKLPVKLVSTNSYSVMYQIYYILFILSLFYASSFLPFGKFFHLIGGNDGLIISYIFIFLYLTVNTFRIGLTFDYFKYYIFK
jgi:hypothetical protein